MPSGVFPSPGATIKVLSTSRKSMGCITVSRWPGLSSAPGTSVQPLGSCSGEVWAGESEGSVEVDRPSFLAGVAGEAACGWVAVAVLGESCAGEVWAGESEGLGEVDSWLAGVASEVGSGWMGGAMLGRSGR